jgi:hypothetical protein
MPEPLFDDCQEQVFDDYEVFIIGQQGKCLDHFVPIVFLSIL